MEEIILNEMINPGLLPDLTEEEFMQIWKSAEKIAKEKNLPLIKVLRPEFTVEYCKKHFTKKYKEHIKLKKKYEKELAQLEKNLPPNTFLLT